MPIKQNELNLDIIKAAYGGYGIGFYEKKVIFVINAIPGDSVHVKIINDKKDYSIAEIVKIIKPSDKRIEPECINFGRCGGCSYLNTEYLNEIALKKEILINNLEKTAKISQSDIPEIDIVQNNRYHYRSHAYIKTDNNQAGFYQKNSNTLIPFPKKGCILLADEINENILKHPSIIKEYKIGMDMNHNVFRSCSEKRIIRECEENIFYERDIDLFFQGNRFLRSEMLKRVKEYSELNDNESIFDIDCGVGFFTLYLAKHIKSGIGFDINKESILWARHNAKLNTIKNITFYALPSSDIHPFKHDPSTIIIDPPRAGITKKTRQTIITLHPDKIIYISCDPSTFSRDAKDFVQAGYTFDKLCMIDMFPGTHHIEVISRFARE